METVSTHTDSGQPGLIIMSHELFHEGGPYHAVTSPLICRADQWIGLYMIKTSVMKELKATLNRGTTFVFDNND